MEGSAADFETPIRQLHRVCDGADGNCFYLSTPPSPSPPFVCRPGMKSDVALLLIFID